jgi:uncharacterized protein (TIGR02284 family)
MTAASGELASRLRALLLEVEDGKRGFALAAQECELPELKPLLQECADECTRALHELQGSAQTVSQGHVQGGSPAGAVRQGWTRLSAAFKDSTLAALDEAEREQERIEQALAALLEAEPPPAIRKVVLEECRRLGGNGERLARARRRYAAPSQA